MIIKSQIADDKNQVDLNEILEKYGTTFVDMKTITLQIYNKIVGDEKLNSLNDDSGFLGSIVVNGSITITKYSYAVLIQGMLHDDGVFIPYLELDNGSYENGIILSNSYEFDLYVIRV